MKIAVVGAGFAGLAFTYHFLQLRKNVSLTVFHCEESRASTISAGLCHPFPSKGSKLSYMGLQAIGQTIQLLSQAQKMSKEPVACFDGLKKVAYTDELKKKLSALSRKYPRLIWDPSEKDDPYIKGMGRLEIENGMTVYSEVYVKALENVCQSKGAIFKHQKIEDLDQLKGFDQIVLCVGAQIVNFTGKDKSRDLVKGQLLKCKMSSPLSHSLIFDGYLAKSKESRIARLASTYEHHYDSEDPDPEFAKEHIFNKLRASLPKFDHTQVEVLDVEAGIRVTNKKNGLPEILKIKDNTYAITKLGSRGLLYHSMLGFQLAQAIDQSNDELISDEFFRDQS